MRAWAGEPQGLGVACTWKCHSWGNQDPDGEEQVLEAHPIRFSACCGAHFQGEGGRLASTEPSFKGNAVLGNSI